MKLPYIKPEMCEVKLIVEEAVFSGCKTQQPGPRSASGGTNVCYGGTWGGGATPCNSMGS